MQDRPAQRMTSAEFVALIAMLFSTVAFSIDALLPVMPQMAVALDAPGRVHLVITLFMGGLALGTLLAGPLSDTLGRKPVMYAGAGLYIGAGLVAWISTKFEIVILARLIQGLGAAGPRVVSLAIVRDLYTGRQMARIVSFAMVLFTLVPTLAPAMGALLAELFGWRAILLSFVVFTLISTFWIWLRLVESLPRSARKPFRPRRLIDDSRTILRHPTVRPAILTQGVALSLIICLIVHVQPIYGQVFDRADSFPYWFGGIALFSAASTSLVNASLVVRLGMRRMVTFGMAGQVISVTCALILMRIAPEYAFPAFVIWQFLLIWMSGLCVGNLNALALEPMGHIAGLAASLTGAISTALAALIAAISGAFFNGTQFPLMLTTLALALTGTALMWRMNQVSRSADPALATRRTP